MPGSNYSFTSGANTGLNFSGNNDAEEPVESKSPMRMAGEVFSNQNNTNNSNSNSSSESTGSWWRNQYSNMTDSSSSSSSNASANTNSTPSSTSSPSPSADYGSSASGAPYKAKEQSAEKRAAYEAEQQQAKDNLASRAKELSASYDPAKYQYYTSEFGSGTGSEAYGKDMANYESWVAMNNSDGVGGGHLGLVAEMMHPDWGRSQKTGGGNPIVEQDYSSPGQGFYSAKEQSLKSGRKDGYGSPYVK